MNMMERVRMKKGFTLVELLVVIAILGIIAVMVTTSVIRIMNRSRDSLSESQISTLEKAAEQWGTINPDKMPLDNSVYEVNIKTLADEGYIDSSDLENPKNGADLCGVVQIKYDSSKNQYRYNFVERNC